MTALGSLVAFPIGVLFGVGLVISGMIHPEKVQDFLDFAGRWDPSLAFVMSGALGVTFLAFPRILRRSRPRFAEKFYLPVASKLDVKLVAGAALFGVGWGLSGFCPGPAVVGVATGARPALIFVGAMLMGMVLHRLYDSVRRPRQPR